MVDIILSASFGILFDDVLSLSFSADKQNLTALSGNVARGGQSRIQHRIGFLQVDDVDVVFLSVDVRSHLRVPAACMVTEMNTCFNHLA